MKVFPEGPKKIIFVLPRAIAENFKDGGNRPVMLVRCDGQEVHCSGVKIDGPSSLCYDNQNPQPGDGRVWIETISQITCQS